MLEATIGRPYALYVQGNNDTTGLQLWAVGVAAMIDVENVDLPVIVYDP